MRIIFAGTPEYAVPSLRALAALKPQHEVVAVVTQPDRPQGRSRQPVPPPVKEEALRLGLSPDAILQPRSINAPAVLAALGALAPDFCCVVAYGGILKAAALALPKLGCLNAHGSLLPEYRGAAPIAAALLAGNARTGVSIIKLIPALDAGPVLLQRATPIPPDATAGTLHDTLAELSAGCFVEALRLLETGQATFTPQDSAQATYAPKLEKDSGRLDWSRDAAYLERFVRAMTPWPGAWTQIAAPDFSARRRLRVAATGLPESPAGASAPGAVRPGASAGQGRLREASLDVVCGDGLLLPILAVQPEGKREMKTEEFLRGAGRAYLYGCRLT